MNMCEENIIYNARKEKMPMEGGSSSRNKNGNKSDCFQQYPEPLAQYSDVIADRGLFMQTLEKFHAAMRTKFMIPIVGGKDLDLHKLFKEVTSRGGIDKVIGERRWKEVTGSFVFPSTATNSSFILRKYYYSLLHHYERLYFFGSEGYKNTADNMPSPLAQSSSKRQQDAMLDSPPVAQKRKIRDEPTLPAMPLTGVIDGRFEHGYLVTVKIGSHTLRGALFHCSEQPFPDSVKFPQPITFNSSPAFTAGMSNPQAGPRYQSVLASGSLLPYIGASKQRRRRKKRPSTMDPNHPKPNRSGYNFFFAEQHALLKPLHPGKDRDISRIIGERWNGLTEAEKNVYQERGRVDKERYRSELALYKGKQSTDPSRVISDAVPLNQRPANSCEFTVEGVDVKVEEGDLVLAADDRNSDSDDSDDDDGDKNQDIDPDTGSNLGSGSESDASIDDAIAQVPVECQSIGDVGPQRQTGAGGFELRKREGTAPVVEAEYKAAEDSSNSTEDGVKMGEHSDNLVEAAEKVVEGLNNPVEGDMKAGKGLNNPVEGDLKGVEGTTNPVDGDVKAGEGTSNPVEDDLKMGESSNNPAEEHVKMGEHSNDVKASEGYTTPVQGNVTMVEEGIKSGEDTNNLVAGGVKSGEETDNPTDGDVKMAEAHDDTISDDVKTGEEFNHRVVGDVPKGNAVCKEVSEQGRDNG